MILFDCSADDTRDANAVAAHGHGAILTIAVLHSRIHGLAVLGAQLEDVPDLDATRDAERTFSTRRRITGDDVTDIDGLRHGQITLEIDADVVEAMFVRTARKVCKGTRPSLSHSVRAISAPPKRPAT